jgi:hypothetical protein
MLTGKWKGLFFFTSLKPKQDSKEQQQDLSYGPKAEFMYHRVLNLWKHESFQYSIKWSNLLERIVQNRPTKRIINTKQKGKMNLESLLKEVVTKMKQPLDSVCQYATPR